MKPAIDVRAEIIPALERRKRGYGDSSDAKAELRLWAKLTANLRNLRQSRRRRVFE